MNIQSEASLVRSAQKGDREAFGALWEMLTPRLLGYLVNTLRDKTLAEDILQSTWLAAIEKLPNSRHMRLSPWLFVIARNECKQHWRKSGREIPLDIEEHDVPDGHEAALDNKALIDQVLASLSESDREILRLRYIAELPLSDIAAVLNLNAINVRVRIHRALGRARTLITA